MEPKDAIGRGLSIYRTEMRSFIRETLQAKYGEAWFSEQVAPLLHGKQKRDRGLRAVLARGQSAERQIDVGDFAIVIANHGDLFPEPIRRGQHHHGRLDELRDDRNKHAHDEQETLYPADAEAVLGRCREVLSLCGRMSAVQAIESIARQLSAASQGQEASVPTLIEDAAPPPITDVSEYPVDEPLPPSSLATLATDDVVESRGIVTTLRDVRDVFAVVGVIVTLAVLVTGIAVAVHLRSSGDDSSTPTSQGQVTETAEPEQEDIAIPSENGRGGGVQEQTAAAGNEPPDEGGSTQEQTAIVAQQASIEDDLCRVVDVLSWLPRLSDAPIQLDGTWSSSDCESPWTGRSYSDRYQMVLPERSSITIDLTSNGGSYLSLFNADEDLLTSDDDSGQGVNSRITRTLEAGKYYIEASTWNRNETGPYNLRISHVASAVTGVQRPVIDAVDCSPWPPDTTGRVRCAASLSPSGGEPDTYSWSGGKAGGSNATYITSFDPSSRTQMVLLDVRNSTGDTSVVLFGTWAGSHTATASDLLSGLEGAYSISLWRDGAFLIFHGNLNESADFEIATGDILWLDPAEAGSLIRLTPVPRPEPIENDDPLSCADDTVDLGDDQDDAVSPKTVIGYAKLWDVAQGRIVMRVQDGDDDDDYRIEFGFLPEWMMDSERSWEEAVEAWADYLPAQRHLTESVIERQASGDAEGWLCSSPISVPAKLPDSLGDATPEIIGRVAARLSPDADGRLRIEFGFQVQVTSVDVTDGQREVTRHLRVLMPSSDHYVTEMTIADGRDMWLRSAAVDVFTGPDPLGGFARCGSNEPVVFYIDQVNWTKHRVEITDDQATLIFGPSWQETLRTLLPSGCDWWKEGDIYGFADVRRIRGS